MALPIQDLDVSYTNALVSFSGRRIFYRLDYKLIHIPTQASIYSSFRQKQIISFEELPNADAELREEIGCDLLVLKEWHKSRSVLGEASVYDALRTLDRWIFSPTTNGWTLYHPVSGTFSGVQLDEGIVGHFQAVRSLVLPLPTWTFVTAGVEEVEVSCVAVPGAQSYNIYDDITYLANVPNAGKNTIPLAAGVYRIRMGAVDGMGKTGILGNETQVTVLTSGAAITMMEESIPPNLEPEPSPSGLSKWLSRLGKK